VQHKLATRLPVFDKTIKTLESDIAGLTTTKAEKNGTTQALARIEKKVSDVETRNKRALGTLGKANAKAKSDVKVISKSVAKAIETGNAAAKKTAQLEASIDTLTAALKAEQRKVKTLTTRAAGDGETIAFLQKELSLVKKKADTLDHTFVDRTFFDQELARIKKGYDKKIDSLIRLVEKGDKADKAKIPVSTGTTPAKPTPSGTISEKDLLQ
jgi:chromosome segregation ATPase